MALPGDSQDVDAADSKHDNQSWPAEDAGVIVDLKDTSSPPASTSTIEPKDIPPDLIESDTT